MQSSLEDNVKKYWAISNLVRTHKMMDASVTGALANLREAVINEPKLLARVINLQKGAGLKVA